MSAHFDFIPRADAGPVSLIDDSMLGAPQQVGGGLVRFDKLGTELGTESGAVAKMARFLAKRWSMDPNCKEVMDAAADFTYSTLEKVLGPSANLRRGEDRPYIFVPRQGRPLALESQNLLPPGWRTNSYQVLEPTGQAHWLEPHSVRKLPHVDFSQEKKENGAHYYGVKYAVSIPDQWEANILDIDVLGERVNAATEALDAFRERVSGVGDVLKKLPGMFTLGDALIGLGGQTFSSGSVDAPTQMRRLANFQHLYFRANRERVPTMLIAPYSDKYAMENTYFTGTSDSVWEKASAKYAWLRDAVWTDRAALANAAGNAPRWVLYSKNINELYIEHTESRVFGPFQDYMMSEFVVLRRHGGVVSKRPERVLYVDFTP